METIGMRISRAMKDAKVSQTSLANAMGVDQQHVSRMLKMSDAEMKIGFAIGAAEALKMSPQYILFGEAGLSGSPAPVIAPIVEELNHATTYPKTVQAHLFGGILAQLKKSRELIDGGEWR